jgi:hypothetical protein
VPGPEAEFAICPDQTPNHPTSPGPEADTLLLFHLTYALFACVRKYHLFISARSMKYQYGKINDNVCFNLASTERFSYDAD